MKDNRTVRRSFIPRLGAERQWRQLYLLLLEMGQPSVLPSAEAPAVAPLAPREVPHECGCLCPRFHATASPRADH
jgi:hypothetical protein